MGVELIGYRWVCDWCGTAATTTTDSTPRGWRLAYVYGEHAKLITKYLCGDGCWRAHMKATELIKNTMEQVVGIVEKHWQGIPSEDLPKAENVRVVIYESGVARDLLR